MGERRGRFEILHRASRTMVKWHLSLMLICFDNWCLAVYLFGDIILEKEPLEELPDSEFVMDPISDGIPAPDKVYLRPRDHRPRNPDIQCGETPRSCCFGHRNCHRVRRGRLSPRVFR